MEDNKFTPGKLKEIFRELFYKDIPEKDKEYVESLDKEVDLKDQILSGYPYQITTEKSPNGRSIAMCTGMGGVHQYIDECRKHGLPDSVTIQSIQVFVDEKWYPLSSARKTKTDGK